MAAERPEIVDLTDTSGVLKEEHDSIDDAIMDRSTEADKVKKHIETFVSDKAKRTAYTYRRYLRDFLDFLNEKNEGKLDVHGVKKYFVWVTDHNRENAFPYSTHSVRIYSTRAFLNLLYAMEEIPKPLAPFIGKPKAYVPQKRRDTVDTNVFQKLLKACENEDESLLVKILFYSGARMEEICNMHQDDFVLFTGANGKKMFRTKILGKGNKVRRINIPCFSELQRAMDYHGNGYLFPSNRENASGRERLMYQSLKDRFSKIARRIGKGDITPHHLRHGAAYHLQQQGWPISKISKHLGHSNVRVTQRYLDRDLEEEDVMDIAELEE